MADTPIEDLAKILDDNNKLVHKWGTQLLAIADYSTPMPTSSSTTTST